VRDHLLKRIFLESETKQIRRMQLNAPEFTRHYPKHAQWLDKAIAEILDGRRVAFGVQAAALSEKGKPHSELVGSIILKESDYSGVVELKNLFISPEARRKKWGASLFNMAEVYCRKNGHLAIQTEVPCEELPTVAFLHAMGFNVIDMGASPYRIGENIYHMQKAISPMYNGDVFDFEAQAIWALQHNYNFVRDVSEVKKPYYEFGLPLSESAKLEPARVRGLAVILSDSSTITKEKIISHFEGKSANIKMLFSPSIDEEGKSYCKSNGIKCFDAKDMFEMFGDKFVQPIPTFGISELAGMIISLKPELYERISPDGSSFVYCKGGPSGKYLRQHHQAVLAVDEPLGDDDYALRAIGRIDIVDEGNPADIWTVIKTRHPLFTDKEYFRFASAKQSVVAFTISSLKQISPLPLSVLADHLPPKEITNDDLGHLYLSRDMVAVVNQKASDTRAESEPREYDVALSFAREDRAHAEAIADILRKHNVRVFYDRYEEGDLWGKDLYQHLQKIYRDQAQFCVVFLSRSYAKRLWTNHELKQAQARAFRSRKEYILPVKIDDTEIPGINETTGYVDIRERTHQDIAGLVLAKLASRKIDGTRNPS
jgi:ribosomal protein S18 acetylase RimI-like enzyme